MTREEALEWFKDRKKMNLDDKCQQAEDRAIKALEQEPILEKIRAEIEQARYGLVNDGLDIALNIIDKYKAESEE